MLQNRVPRIPAGANTPLSLVDISVKDPGIVLDQMNALTVPLSVARADC